MRKMRLYTVLILATGATMVITLNSGLFGALPEITSKKAAIQLDAPPIDTSTLPLDVDTGTSTIPTFPRYIELPAQDVGKPSGALPAGTAAVAGSTGKEGIEEYQLMGLGVRTVSFLGIQVYVVGLYIAVSDIATLQERLIRSVDPIATTLVANERSKLQDLLLDPIRGEQIWNTILKDGSIRTAVRIVPTRNTDFNHLRDGWIRGITGRTQQASASGSSEYNDESFGDSINQFKSLFAGGRGKLPKGETLYLLRNSSGKLEAWYEDKSTSSDNNKNGEPIKTKNRTLLGEVADERISRLIWLGYLAGKNVSSESARQSVVNGVMEFVERPVGTVATQVV